MREVVTIGIMGTSGVMTVGDLLLKVSEKMGYFAFIQRHNTSQVRDGPVATKITIDSQRPRECCDDEVDILLCFSWQKLFARDFPLKQNTLILSEEALHFGSLAQEKTGSRQAQNMIGLGLIAGYLGLSQKSLRQILVEEFQQTTKTMASNLECLLTGFALAVKTDNKDFMLKGPNHRVQNTVTLDGNKAVVMGIVSAHCQFLGFYPITPSTDIAEAAIREILAKGGMFIQSEDEIAAINACLGASEAGVKSLDVTSGPGLDLKTETIGLAVMDEVPLVIVNIQRAGPATGLATMTEQSDLWQAVKGGHGDAPRVVLAPDNIEGCHRLTIEAFNISEEYQVPVILLSDQWLGQAKAILPRDFLDKDYVLKERLKPAEIEKENYARSKITSDFISPMANVGDEGLVYQTAGSTHNERGRPSADFDIHQQMHEKRQKKLEPLRQRTDLVKIFGPAKAKIGIVTWGSTARVVREVLRSQGLEQDIKVCVPELLSPLPVKMLQEFLNGLKKVLFVEMNYSGQFYRHLRTEVNLPKNQSFYFRAGGLPFLQKEISDWLEEALNGK